MIEKFPTNNEKNREKILRQIKAEVEAALYVRSRDPSYEEGKKELVINVPVEEEDKAYLLEMERAGVIKFNNENPLSWESDTPRKMKIVLTNQFNKNWLNGWLAPSPEENLEVSA